MLGKDVAMRQLLEFYGIPPHHNSIHRGDTTVVTNLEGAFGKPLPEIESDVGFTRIQQFYETQARRVGKEISALVKQQSYR